MVLMAAGEWMWVVSATGTVLEATMGSTLAKLPPSLWFSMEAESCWGARTRTDPGMTGAGTAGITPAEAAAAEAKTATKAFILSVLKKDVFRLERIQKQCPLGQRGSRQ